MDDKTLNLINRPYQEIVDDILTAIVGGVVNEPVIFDVKVDLYPLAEPARDVRGITGRVNGELYSFQKEIDFLFSEGDNALIWQEGGKLPDDETIFYIDYFRRESRSPLTDINVGSVTRTLSEAIGREIATVYQQINQSYFSAFIDTAKGKSLDLVVAILGITRKTEDFAVGLVTFFRDPAIKGNITIPEGVLLRTTKGEVNFQTSERRTLQRGQVRIDVPIRAGEEFKGEAGKVESGKITELAQPIAGISRVTNFEPTYLGAENESDEQLRERAKAVLRGMGKGTLAALARVIFEGRAKLTEALDPNSPQGKQADPGSVVLFIESEPERFPSLRAAVEETRAAGVQTTLVARYVYFKPRLAVEISKDVKTAIGKTKVIDEIITALQKYVDDLSSGDPATGEELLKAIKDVEDVKKVTIKDVMAWRADTEKPDADAFVNLILNTVASVPPGDSEALRTAVSDLLTESKPTLPTGGRIPDRSLVQGPGGERATDQEIESGDFQVTAVVNGEKWFVFLDIDSADIVLMEKES